MEMNVHYVLINIVLYVIQEQELVQNVTMDFSYMKMKKYVLHVLNKVSGENF